MKKTKIFLAVLLIVVGVSVTFCSAKSAYAASNVAACNNYTHNNLPSQQRKLEYFTGYSYYDNTPAQSPAIAFPKSDGWKTVHNVAGGVGTYANPITMAVGWCKINGREYPDYKPGTRFYIPRYKRYFIVEDECGDGNYPQGKPCHVSEYRPSVYHQFDLYVNGKGWPRSRSDATMDAITGLHYIIQNPPSGLPVISGSLTWKH